jgi:hypothetical protein
MGDGATSRRGAYNETQRCEPTDQELDRVTEGSKLLQHCLSRLL